MNGTVDGGHRTSTQIIFLAIFLREMEDKHTVRSAELMQYMGSMTGQKPVVSGTDVGQVRTFFFSTQSVKCVPWRKKKKKKYIYIYKGWYIGKKLSQKPKVLSLRRV